MSRGFVVRAYRVAPWRSLTFTSWVGKGCRTEPASRPTVGSRLTPGGYSGATCARWCNGDNFASRDDRANDIFTGVHGNSTLIFVIVVNVVSFTHHCRKINFSFPRETRENAYTIPGNSVRRTNVNYIIETSDCCDFENPLFPAVVDSSKPTECRSFILMLSHEL